MGKGKGKGPRVQGSTARVQELGSRHKGLVFELPPVWA
jgi:hypothetical protein